MEGRQLTWLITLSLLLLASCSEYDEEARHTGAVEARPAVQLKNTMFLGNQRPNGVAEFKGIRFAAPPVGTARWEAASLFTPVESEIDATSFGPACPQNNGTAEWYRSVAEKFGQSGKLIRDLIHVSEDCLFLNIWSSRLGSEGQPVMVWIHGGSNVTGHTFEPNYSGHTLAERGVVVISLQYRMGALGFLPLPFAETSGNTGFYGISDLIAGLKWVQENVTAFGGDPDNVTLFGESAGGGNIAALLRSEKAKGLFHKAIIQSGAIAPTVTVAEANAMDAARSAFGKADINSLAEAKKVPWQSFIDIGPPDYYYAPVADDVFVRKGPDHNRDIPLMIGSNSNEWLMYYGKDEKQALAQALEAYSDKAAALEFVGERFDTALEKADYLDAKADFFCPSLTIAHQANLSGSKAYMYEFSRKREDSDRIKAYHGAELPYVFGTHDDWLPTVEEDLRLTETMMSYWVNFARTGDPNGPELPRWAPYTQSAPYVQELGDVVAALPDEGSIVCAFLNKDKS